MDASLYHAFYEVEDRHWWFTGRRAIVDGFLERSLGAPAGDPERRILDVGCGTGGMLPLLSKYGAVTGVDSEPLALDYCRKRGITDVHLQEGFAPAEPYDVVTIFDVLEHVEDEAGFLATLSGYLKPGGRLVVTVPAFQFLWSRHDELNFHQRRYDRAGLVRALESAGFELERVSYFNMFLFPLAAVVRLFDSRKPVDSGKAPEEVLRHLKIGPLNGVLGTIFGAERHLLKGLNLPYGVSLGAVARRLT